MKIPSYMDSRELARSLGGFSAAEQILEWQRTERERMLRVQSSVLEPSRQMAEIARLGAFDPSKLSGLMTSAVEAARLAGHLNLPDTLERYRQTDTVLASRLVDAYQMPWWMDSHLEALSSHAALSNMLDETRRVDHSALSAIESMLSSPIRGLESVRQARQFLGISGLLRYPRLRVLTKAEKRRHVKSLVKENAAPTHVRKAHSITHRYELTLRAVIARCMEDAYGEDWATERLPECDCKKLLGKQLEGDETVLDHADYTQYAAILSHAKHFEAVFSKGFDNAEELSRTLLRVGQLRARAHHARTFTAEDLRELAMLWRAIEAGLIELIDDMILDP